MHHRWIATYTAAVTDQLRQDANLTRLADPGQRADRAGYYMAAWLHSHPYREGNGRTVRVWVGDLAAAAGHDLDWTRSPPSVMSTWPGPAAAGGYEPMRALLTVAAGGTLGVDRELEALNELDKLQHAQAWARVGRRSVIVCALAAWQLMSRRLCRAGIGCKRVQHLACRR